MAKKNFPQASSLPAHRGPGKGHTCFIPDYLNEVPEGTYLSAELWDAFRSWVKENETPDTVCDINNFTDEAMKMGIMVIYLRNTDEEYVVVEGQDGHQEA